MAITRTNKLPSGFSISGTSDVDHRIYRIFIQNLVLERLLYSAFHLVALVSPVVILIFGFLRCRKRDYFAVFRNYKDLKQLLLIIAGDLINWPIVFLLIILCLTTILFNRSYTLRSLKPTTRVGHWKRIINLRAILGAHVFGILSVLISADFAAMLNWSFNSIIVNCNDEDDYYDDNAEKCVNEEALLLYSAAYLIGFHFFYMNHIYYNLMIRWIVFDFPPGAYLTYRLRNTVVTCLKTCLKMSVLGVLFFFFFGHYITDFCTQSSGKEVRFIAQKKHYLSLYLLQMIKMYPVLACIDILLNMGLIHFKVAIMKAPKFPILSNVLDDSILKFNQALRSGNEYLYKLALLDLKYYSDSSDDTLSQIFTLSHPGGHPYVWNDMLSIFHSLSTRIIKKIDAKVEREELLLRQMNGENLPTQTLTPQPVLSGSSSEEPKRPGLKFRGRNLSPYPSTSDLNQRGAVQTHFSTLLRINLIMDSIYAKLRLLLVLVTPAPLTRFYRRMVTKIPQVEFYNMMIDFPDLFCMLESLSLIIARSPSVDTRGVVHRDLAYVISKISDVVEALERGLILMWDDKNAEKPIRDIGNENLKVWLSMIDAGRNALVRIKGPFGQSLELMGVEEYYIRKFRNMTHLRRLQ